MSRLDVKHLDGYVVVFRSLRTKKHAGHNNNERYFYVSSDRETVGGRSFNRTKQKYKKGYKKKLEKGTLRPHDDDIYDAYKWIIRVLPTTHEYSDKEKGFYLENYMYPKKYLCASHHFEFERSRMIGETIPHFDPIKGYPNYTRNRFFFLGPKQTNPKYLHDVALSFKRSDQSDKNVCQINNHNPDSLRGKKASQLPIPGGPKKTPSDHELWTHSGSSCRFRVYILGKAPGARL